MGCGHLLFCILVLNFKPVVTDQNYINMQEHLLFQCNFKQTSELKLQVIPLI